MGLDLKQYTGDERARLVHLGRQYGSEDTLKQAAKTLLGLEKYSAAEAVRLQPSRMGRCYSRRMMP